MGSQRHLYGILRNRPDDTSIDKSDDKSDVKSDDKSDDKSNGKSDDKPNDKADDKSNDKSNDKSDNMHVQSGPNQVRSGPIRCKKSNKLSNQLCNKNLN